MQNFRKIHGFTLLEMSIVLAIIGLLAGGIVAAKNYIRVAQLTTVINEGKLYMAAVSQFETKYGYSPGDMPNAQSYWNTLGTSVTCPPANGSTDTTNNTCNGNGDGFVFHLDPEGFYLWDHLADAGLIKGVYSGASGSGSSSQVVPGVNAPEGGLPKLTYMIFDPSTDGYVTGSDVLYDGFYRHVLRIAYQVGTTWNYTPFLTPAEAYKIDVKFDNGEATTGFVRAIRSTFNPNCTTADDATAQYNTSYKGVACSLVLQGQ